MKILRVNAFTLYELLITVIIVGIVLAFGIPNLSEFMKNSRLTSVANDLLSTFHLARSEAARSKTNLTICASANSMSTTANCSGTFNDGWIIFTDMNGDLSRGGDGENILRAHPGAPEGITITTNAGANYFAFADTGLGRGNVGGAPSMQTVMICDGRGVEVAAGGRATARRLIATAIGRATIISDYQMILASGGACP